MEIEDPTNLTGLSSLINKNYADTNLDLGKVEKSMIGVYDIKLLKEVDPAKEFEKTIRELSAGAGINLDDNITSEPEYETDPSGTYEGGGHNVSGSMTCGNDGGDGLDGMLSLDSPGGADEMFAEFDAYQELGVTKPTYSQPQSRPPAPSPSMSAPRPTYSSQYAPQYSSQHQPYPSHHNEMDDILNAYSGQRINIDMDRERDEDMKAILIEECQELRAELEKENVDLSRIPEVDSDTPLQSVKDVHKNLRMKYDRKRCNSLGTEIILAGAKGAGWVFNGQRDFGPFGQPDLVGWHNTVRPKLRRLQYETSTIVANAMREWDVGPIGRVVLELVPSAFLYSSSRNSQRVAGRQPQQQGATNYSADQMSEAFEDLRQFD